MMMSVLQEIRGLTKELYFIILSRRKSSFHFVPMDYIGQKSAYMQNFKFIGAMVSEIRVFKEDEESVKIIFISYLV